MKKINYEQLQEIISPYLEDGHKLQESDKLEDDLGLESLDKMYIVTEIEEFLGIYVINPKSSFYSRKSATVADLIAEIKEIGYWEE